MPGRNRCSFILRRPGNGSRFTLFLFGCAAFMVGWRTSWVKWIVLVGQLSYANRNPAHLRRGQIASLIFILCLAPVGARRAWTARAPVCGQTHKSQSKPAAYTSPWACACTRLMQIQMAVLFFFSAAEKFKGDEWWSGDSIWPAFANHEFYNRSLLAVRVAILAGHRRNLSDHRDRDRLSVPDLAAALRGLTFSRTRYSFTSCSPCSWA